MTLLNSKVLRVSVKKVAAGEVCVLKGFGRFEVTANFSWLARSRL